jgi:hypothetical protein
MGRADYAACRPLRADTRPRRSSDRGERDHPAGMALTIQIVANQESQVPEKQQHAGCRPRSAIPLAHLPGEAAVPPGRGETPRCVA